MHTRIPFDLYTTEGVATYRRFLERAADLVASYGGSLSGEHGDGQTRGELLPRMFGEEIVGLFERRQGALRPAGPDEPGQGRPPGTARPSTCGSAAHWAPRDPTPLFFAYPDDGALLPRRPRTAASGWASAASTRTTAGTVMCPSYQVTHEEEHSTRGRARLLFEMLDGHGDGTDHRRLALRGGQGRARPLPGLQGLQERLPRQRRHGDVQGGVPRPALPAPAAPAGRLRHRLAARRRARSSRAPAPAAPINARRPRAGSRRGVDSRLAGLEDRPIPAFATETLQQWWRRRVPPADAAPAGHAGTVLLWPDTFTNHFHPQVGRAAVEVLEDAGWEVTIPTEPLCCGLTWISTGQLDVAKRVLRRTIRALAPHVRAGRPRPGPRAQLHRGASAPTCTSCSPTTRTSHRLKDHTVTLAELLTEHTDGWEPPPRVRYGRRAPSHRCTATSTPS